MKVKKAEYILNEDDYNNLLILTDKLYSYCFILEQFCRVNGESEDYSTILPMLKSMLDDADKLNSLFYDLEKFIVCLNDTELFRNSSNSEYTSN